MKIAILKWILMAGFIFSYCAHGQSIQQAEMELLRLEKQSLSYDSDISKLTTELQPLAQQVDAAKKELDFKQGELHAAGTAMQEAINKHYTEPSSDNEREANRLSREFTLAERSVSRQKLEVERTERDYREVADKIERLKNDKQNSLALVSKQKSIIANLKAEAIAAAEQAANERLAAERAKQIQAEREAAEKAKREQQLAEVAKQEQALAAKPVEPEDPAPDNNQPEEDTPSLNEQKQNINRIINGGGWSSGF